MKRIYDPTAVASAPAVPALTGVEGFFTGGNPGGGTPATRVRAWWLNMVQEELFAFLTAAALTPDVANSGQVLAAARVLFGGGGTLATNGWQKLPGGLILQWGATPALAANGGASMTYPIAFPNNFFAATAIGGATSPGVGAVGIDNANASKTSLGIWAGSGGALAGHFFALGR